MLECVIAFFCGILVSGLSAWLLTIRFYRRQVIKQRRLLERIRRAEQLAEFGALTGHLAHEIRNPLSTIKVNLRLLSEDIETLDKHFKSTAANELPGDLAARYQRQLRKITSVMKEADRMADTLNDFLRYAGRLELHLADHDLNETLDDLIDFYEPQAMGKQIQIRRSLTEGPLLCRIDKDFIKQAVLNLFINAIQVMDEGGELMVRTSRRLETAVIEITDTGPGIPPELQDKVFDPYYTTRSGGTGLGLPTCRRIVEEHNGHIDLHSEPGRGTRFIIELPALNS